MYCIDQSTNSWTAETNNEFSATKKAGDAWQTTYWPPQNIELSISGDATGTVVVDSADVKPIADLALVENSQYAEAADSSDYWKGSGSYNAPREEMFAEDLVGYCSGSGSWSSPQSGLSQGMGWVMTAPTTGGSNIDQILQNEYDLLAQCFGFFEAAGNTASQCDGGAGTAKELAENRLYVFGWDFRLPYDANAKRLDEMLSYAVEENSNQKATVVAHSAGTYLVREYIRYKAQKESSAGELIERAVIVAPPYWGAPKAHAPIGSATTLEGSSDQETCTIDLALADGASDGADFDGQYLSCEFDTYDDSTFDKITQAIGSMPGWYWMYPNENYAKFANAWLCNGTDISSSDSCSWINNTAGTQIAYDSIATTVIPSSSSYLWKTSDQRNSFMQYQSFYEEGQTNSNALTSSDYFTGGIDEFFVIIGSGVETYGGVFTKSEFGLKNTWETTYLNGDGTIPMVSASEGRYWYASAGGSDGTTGDTGRYIGDWSASTNVSDQEQTWETGLLGQLTSTESTTNSVLDGIKASDGDRTTMFACGLEHIELVQNTDTLVAIYDYVVNGTDFTINTDTSFDKNSFYNQPCSVGTASVD